MDLANALVSPPMHSFWLRREVFHHVPTTAQTVADTLRAEQMAVTRDCLSHGICESIAVTTFPRPTIGRIDRGDMSATRASEPKPLTSEPTTRLPKPNDLIADNQSRAIPFNPRRSNNLAIPPPDPIALFRGGEIPFPFQHADLNAVCLLDCPPSASQGPAHNRNPLANLAGPDDALSSLCLTMTRQWCDRGEHTAHQ
jgi:hypothetical protein